MKLQQSVLTVTKNDDQVWGFRYDQFYSEEVCAKHSEGCAKNIVSMLAASWDGLRSSVLFCFTLFAS